MVAIGNHIIWLDAKAEEIINKERIKLREINLLSEVAHAFKDALNYTEIKNFGNRIDRIIKNLNDTRCLYFDIKLENLKNRE